MSTIHVLSIDLERSVGELTAERPERAAIFDRFGIDYCCGGRLSLASACARAGADPAAVVDALDPSRESERPAEPASAALPIADLIRHILDSHHVYLRRELPRITSLAGRCVVAHGKRHPQLVSLADEFGVFAADLELHMLKEERVLFPAILELSKGEQAAAAQCGGIQFPLAAMESEHEDAAVGLARFRELTHGYSAPADACNTWRELCASLARLEADLHHHIHEENNILHPRARELAGLTSR